MALRARRPATTRGTSLTLEWQVSSPPPIFNFDEIPQVVGGPYEYGVPGARHAILHGADHLRTGGHRALAGLIHVLVIANETAASPALLDALRERAAGEDVHVTVIAPVSEPRHGYVVYQDTRRASAGRRLDKTLALLRDSGSRRRASSSRRAR